MNDETTRVRAESFDDKLGQCVVVGDAIAYGHAAGRSACLRIGRVVGIAQVLRGPDGRPSWAIKVRGVDDAATSGAPALCKRDGVLNHPDRTIRVGNLPAKYAQLLEGP